MNQNIIKILAAIGVIAILIFIGMYAYQTYQEHQQRIANEEFFDVGPSTH